MSKKFNNKDLELNINIHIQDAKNVNEVDWYFHIKTDQNIASDDKLEFWIDIDPGDSYWYGNQKHRDEDLELLINLLQEEELSVNINGEPSEY